MGLVMVMLITLVSTTKEFQNDSFYAIKVGQTIMDMGIDMVDHFSFHDNLPYLYPHWLFDLAVGFVYNLGGLDALYGFTLFLTFILGISLWYISYKLSRNRIMSLLGSLLILILMKAFITLRAQMVSFTLFIWEYYYLERLAKTGNKRYIAYLILDCLLVVNVHVAVYPFFFIIFMPFIAEWLVSKVWKRNSYAIDRNLEIKPILMVMGVCLLLGFVSPWEGQAYAYLLKTLTNNTMGFIREHQPLILRDHLVILGFMIGWIFIVTRTRMRVRLHDMLFLMGLTGLAIMSLRQGSMMILIGGVVLIKVIGDYFERYEPKEDKRVTGIMLTGKGMIVTIVFVLLMIVNPVRYNWKRDYINKELYPVEIAKYMKDNLDIGNMRLFNGYEIGSYLMLEGIPVFIDSRCDLYTYNYNLKEDIFGDYIDVVRMNKYYEEIFEKYDISHVLIYKDSNLNVFLERDNNYDVIKVDDYFVLYERLI